MSMFCRIAKLQFGNIGSFQMHSFVSKRILHFLQQNTGISTSSNGFMGITAVSSVHGPAREQKQLFSTSLALDIEQENESKNVLKKISNQLVNNSVGRLFAIVHVAGKQRKITNEDIIVLDKPIEADIGEKIRLNKVLLVGGKDFTLIGRPVLKPGLVKVEATVLEKTLSHSIVSSWYRRRKDYHRLFVRKNFLTFLRIEHIEIVKDS